MLLSNKTFYSLLPVYPPLACYSPENPFFLEAQVNRGDQEDPKLETAKECRRERKKGSEEEEKIHYVNSKQKCTLVQ